ncbi:MAG: hypothetical protein LBT04_01230 [Prevotellaceae bacterium]|nr:hypothetical protein [Prevotellaceae bacterium]
MLRIVPYSLPRTLPLAHTLLHAPCRALHRKGFSVGLAERPSLTKGKAETACGGLIAEKGHGRYRV